MRVRSRQETCVMSQGKSAPTPSRAAPAAACRGHPWTDQATLLLYRAQPAKLDPSLGIIRGMSVEIC